MFATEKGKKAQIILAYFQKIKRTQLLALVLLFTGSFSCEKNIHVSGKYGYSQSQCADKWAHGNTEEDTIKNMIEYLSTKGIRVSSAILTKPPQDIAYCMACTCATGRAFIIDVAIGSEETLTKEGFYKIN
jgi:hypothetical protein